MSSLLPAARRETLRCSAHSSAILAARWVSECAGIFNTSPIADEHQRVALTAELPMDPRAILSY